MAMTARMMGIILDFFISLAYIKDGSGRGCFQPRSLSDYRFRFRFAGLRGAVFFLSACIVWIPTATVTAVVIIVQTVLTQSLTSTVSPPFTIYSISYWYQYVNAFLSFFKYFLASVFRRFFYCITWGHEMISKTRLNRLLNLIKSGNEHEFYTWTEWQKIRLSVLQIDHYECQVCKEKRRRYKRAVIVHHIKHLKDRPDLALSIWDGDERQLISVCKRCHEELHPESQRRFVPRNEPITKERWD